MRLFCFIWLLGFVQNIAAYGLVIPSEGDYISVITNKGESLKLKLDKFQGCNQQVNKITGGNIVQTGDVFNLYVMTNSCIFKVEIYESCVCDGRSELRYSGIEAKDYDEAVIVRSDKTDDSSPVKYTIYRSKKYSEIAK